MTALGWILIVIGAIINFLLGPLLKKQAVDGEINQKALYVGKIIAMWLVIFGAIMIFVAGGKVDVGAIR
ncbi:MAG: hypothetical protein E7393_05025 [Ruminococcaceae bacterium]|nr:hypothetical protein [Oscillospiraceae bacterium]